MCVQAVGSAGTRDSKKRGLMHRIKLWTSVPHLDHKAGAEEIRRITAFCLNSFSLLVLSPSLTLFPCPFPFCILVLTHIETCWDPLLEITVVVCWSSDGVKWWATCLCTMNDYHIWINSIKPKETSRCQCRVQKKCFRFLPKHGPIRQSYYSANLLEEPWNGITWCQLLHS